MPITRSQAEFQKHTQDEATIAPALPPPTPKLWLDVLPDDVCVKIANHVSGGRRTKDVLNLGEASPTQRKVVISAASCFVIATHSGAFYDARWSRLLRDDVVDLRLHYCRSPSRRAVHVALLKSPKLRKITLPSDPECLRAVPRSSSITEVRIWLDTKTSPRLLLHALSAVNLKHLSLSCPGGMQRGVCSFRDLKHFNVKALAANCPNVASVRFRCCFPCRNSEPPWQLVCGLERLHQVTLERTAGQHPAEVVRKLSTLRSVEFIAHHNAHQLALPLGAAVTTCAIHLSTFLSAENVAALAGCTRLKRLKCSLEEGADVALPDTLRSIVSLESLHLEWRLYPTIYTEGLYVPATPGVILRAVKASSSLTSLRLNNVRLRNSELIAILRSVGSRLEEFGTPLSGQEESPFDRLEILLQTFESCNPTLKMFSLNEDFLHLFGVGVTASDLERSSRQGHQLLTWLQFLKERRSPRLETWHLPRMIKESLRNLENRA